MAAISIKADLQCLKARHHKYHLTDCAFNKCYYILCFRVVNVQKYSFTTRLCDAETIDLWGMMLKTERGALPSASHMDRSSLLTSFWLASSFKIDHSAWLLLVFFLQIRQHLSVIYLFIFPTFYSTAMVMDDKAQGVSGAPWTKTLWPSALAWLCQSSALLTAEWNAEW